MGSSIVMATLTSFTTKLEDTWNIGKVNNNLHGKSARKMQRKLVFHVREKLSKGFSPCVCVPPLRFYHQANDTPRTIPTLVGSSSKTFICNKQLQSFSTRKNLRMIMLNSFTKFLFVSFVSMPNVSNSHILHQSITKLSDDSKPKNKPKIRLSRNALMKFAQIW